MNAAHPLRQNGFTLIELMVVVAVVALLSAIAYPSYQEHLRRTRRIDCEGVLMSAAAAQERHHASTGRYTSLQKEFGRCPAAGASKFYDVSIVPAKPTTSYTLKAVPVGIQQKDTCGTLTLTHNGQKGLEKATATDTGRCWQ